jgi:hypothetical protein
MGDKYLDDCNDGWDEKYVIDLQEDIVQMVLGKQGETALKFYEMTRSPKVGLAPLDIFLDANGKAAANPMPHVGHPIVEML